MKKLFIKTYGCQMNVYDSARMADLLAPLGYAPAESATDADMVILNTCHIREKASEKVFSELGKLKELKDQKAADGGAMMIAVAGCVAQAEGAEIVRRQKAVDIVVGPQSYHRLPELIARITRERGHALETDFPAQDKFDSLPEEISASGPAALLTVQEGCDKFCTFCVVPYTRGAEYSRPVEQILSEARRLVAKGVREITLLGQNVNAYSGAGFDGEAASLAQLICALAKIDRLARIRYMTSHPRDMGDDLIAAHGEIEQLMPSASAGAVGFGSHSRRDEPPAHARRLSASGRAHSRVETRARSVFRFHRRIPRRDGQGFRGHTLRHSPGRLRVGFLVQIQSAPGNAGGRGEHACSRRGDVGAAGGAAIPSSGTAARV